MRGVEWDYWPEPEGEPFTDKDGNEIVGWHDRVELHCVLLSDGVAAVRDEDKQRVLEETGH
jgi:hypothetical protein